MFILLIDIDDDTWYVVFNDLSLHDKVQINLIFFILDDPIVFIKSQVN